VIVDQLPVLSTLLKPCELWLAITKKSREMLDETFTDNNYINQPIYCQLLIVIKVTR